MKKTVLSTGVIINKGVVVSTPYLNQRPTTGTIAQHYAGEQRKKLFKELFATWME